MSVTLHEIAQKASVSHMTVSRVLNGKEKYVAKNTRERVVRVAAELGYRPNINARAFAKRKSLLIGVLYNEVNYMQATQFLVGVQETLDGHDYVPVFLTHNGPQQEQTNLEQCLARGVDGLIVNPWAEDGIPASPRYTELMESGIPIVEVHGRQIQDAPWVCYDQVARGRMVARHLIERGHRRIALFTYEHYRSAETMPGRAWDAHEQWQGYMAEMKEAELDPIVITHPISKVPNPRGGISFFYDAALESANKIFDHPAKPTGVICYATPEAYAVVHVAQQRGIDVPKELSVVGSDTSGTEWLWRPQLSRTLSNAVEVGRVAAAMILDRLESKQIGPTSIPPIWEDGETVADGPESSR